MLNGRELLNGRVSAMVIGENEAIVGDDLASAAAAEDDYGVFDGTVVDTVNLFGRQAAALLLHDVDVVLAEEAENPHALIGEG